MEREIEITPKMASAGADALSLAFGGAFDHLLPEHIEEAAIAVFEAIAAAAQPRLTVRRPRRTR